MVNIFLPIDLTYVLGAKKNRLTKTVLSSIYNIYILVVCYALLTKGLQNL